MPIEEEKLKVYNQMKMMDGRCGDRWVSVFSPVASNQKKMDDWKSSLLNGKKRKRRGSSLFFPSTIFSSVLFSSFHIGYYYDYRANTWCCSFSYVLQH